MTHPEPPAQGRNTGRLDDPTQLDDVAAEGTSALYGPDGSRGAPASVWP